MLGGRVGRSSEKNSASARKKQKGQRIELNVGRRVPAQEGREGVARTVALRCGGKSQFRTLQPTDKAM